MKEIISGGIHGVVGGLTGNKVQQLAGAAPYLATNGEDVHCDIRSMVQCLQYLCHKEEDKAQHPYYETVLLQPGAMIPMHNESHNRAYNMALVSASTVVNFQVEGLGQAFSLTLPAGWSVLNMPDGTLWGLPSNASNNVAVKYCASNSVFGNAI